MTWVEPGWFDLVKEGGRRPLGYDLLGHGDADTPDDIEAYKDLVTPLSSSCRSRRTKGARSTSSATRSGRARRSTSPCAIRNWCVGWCWVASAATSSRARNGSR